MKIPQSFFSSEKEFRISHEKNVLFLGSCFSEHVSARLRQAGFEVLSNPFGVIFHPVPMARFVLESLRGANDRIIQREDVFLSYDSSGEVYAMERQLLAQKLKEQRDLFAEKVRTASTLIVSFGSAHGYFESEHDCIVANCHKMPSQSFKKELSEISVLLQSWEEAVAGLREINPKLQLIFTVSPVRYIRDGWTENNRSKARLLQLCEELEKDSQAEYFPAYEIVTDILRDYRFFERDGAHPNELAIDEVWKVFSERYFPEGTKSLVARVMQLRQMEAHRLLHPESEASARFREKFRAEKQQFLIANSVIRW